MNEYRKKILEKYLNSDYLNDFENKKFKQYLDKINIMTYMMYENDLDNLNPEYVEWCKIKIQKTNYELSKDKQLMKFLNK